MQVPLVIFGLAIGLILLVRGADEMIKCAIHIAQKYKIPQSIVGAVYIGFGTSAPEWVLQIHYWFFQLCSFWLKKE